MQRYTELGSVVELIDDLARDGYRTEAKVSANGGMSGGAPFSRGMLYRLLANPVYRGITVHKGRAHPGEHEAIVSEELWDKVQRVLAERTQGHSRRMKAKEPSLFVGLLVDGEGRAMTPSHSVKGKVRYRYYITRPDLVDDTQAWRVSAHDLEQLVCERMASFLGDQHELSKAVGKLVADARAAVTLFQSAERAAATLRDGTSPARLQRITKLVDHIELRTDDVAVHIDPLTLVAALGVPTANKVLVASIELRCPATRVWHGRQLRLVIPGPADVTRLRLRSPTLIRLMGEVREARQLVLVNADQSISRIARTAGRCRVRLNDLLRLACLSPDIVTAILAGRQPVGLSATVLLNTPLPLDWREQKVQLGFA